MGINTAWKEVVEPLLTLTIVTLVLHGFGITRFTALRPWIVPLRFGLAAMFVLTGTAHFVGLRKELIEMVPPSLPAPAALVTITGVVELAGAAGLVWTRTTRWSALGLVALLIVMFPANVQAARQALSPPFFDRLVPRTILQILFIAAALRVWSHHPRPQREHETQ
jgi:uncharacterized membrane protein